jgi:hypothetical protein
VSIPVRPFSLVAAIEKIFGANRLEIDKPSTPPASGILPPSADFYPDHTILLRPNTGVPAFGPAILPRSEQHHESRAACASYLRARMFESVSRDAPRMNRRERRRLAKQFARNEYRRMMADDSNSIGEAEPCN